MKLSELPGASQTGLPPGLCPRPTKRKGFRAPSYAQLNGTLLYFWPFPIVSNSRNVCHQNACLFNHWNGFKISFFFDLELKQI